MAKPNLFNSIKLNKPRKNKFDLTHDVKMSMDMGNLVPILALECVPGDSFKLSCESLLRFAPLVAPVMHRMNVFMHYFFVPNRLLWDGWEPWITDASSERVPPNMTLTDALTAPQKKFLDYMGIPPNYSTAKPLVASPMACAAYQMIYNEYYRDQNLIAPVNYKLNDGGVLDGTDLLTLRKRAWQHDYFTASLPWAQKGNAVDIPLAQLTDAPIKMSVNPPVGNTVLSGSNLDPLVEYGTPNDPNGDIDLTNLYADNSGVNAESTTVNDLRRAFKLQEWLERNARAGTRYIENIFGHFGVKSSDARLNRPEYITGTKSPVVISEVLNTTGEAAGLPQGNMAGHGISVTSGKYGKYFCEEHGYIIGIMSVMPLPAYQQGVPKHFLKYDDQFKFFWPSFAHIGEQEVLNKEIYLPHTTPDGTFGYVPRYAEYKYMPSRVAGDFRTTLDYWHLGRIFANDPNLNQTFIECDPGKRIFAVEDPDTDSLYVHVLNKISAIRPMPKFGNPTF